MRYQCSFCPRDFEGFSSYMSTWRHVWSQHRNFLLCDDIAEEAARQAREREEQRRRTLEEEEQGKQLKKRQQVQSARLTRSQNFSERLPRATRLQQSYVRCYICPCLPLGAPVLCRWICTRESFSNAACCLRNFDYLMHANSTAPYSQMLHVADGNNVGEATRIRQAQGGAQREEYAAVGAGEAAKGNTAILNLAPQAIRNLLRIQARNSFPNTCDSPCFECSDPACALLHINRLRCDATSRKI